MPLRTIASIAVSEGFICDRNVMAVVNENLLPEFMILLKNRQGLTREGKNIKLIVQAFLRRWIG
jgi:hypothetical protein